MAETVLGVSLAGLVLFVIPITLGIIQGRAPGKRSAELVGIVQLVVSLKIVVGFVVVVGRVSGSVCVLPGRIVCPVYRHLGCRNPFPGDAGVLLAGKKGEFEGVVTAHPT